MELDSIYHEKVYAGVLGKIIGVYLGRPFEQWTYDIIMQRIGEVHYYVNDKLNKPLIVTDDDITGTFTFLRALKDYESNRDIEAKQIGQTWLNYIVEKETILWWGGVGESSEHTAYQNLKNGIFAPQSGSIAQNGKVVAEQIGAQIFIDGWAMVCPGDPEKAAVLAGKAASVSHDGEAVYGAKIVAALESYAFVETDISKLLSVAKTLIPQDSSIFRLISDIEEWYSSEKDWKKTRQCIENRYGYQHYPGGCHIIPNHALIILSLLYGEGDFDKTMNIVNTAGWDTDCNSGNVGCLIGIRNGLKSFDSGTDWRGPVSDIMYCPTADGSQTITDALTESYKIIKIANQIRGIEFQPPKNGARYNFEMSGSVQGWRGVILNQISNSSFLEITNVEGHSNAGSRSLKIRYNLAPTESGKIFTNSFFPQELKQLSGEAKKTFFSYNFLCCPQIYSGQLISSEVTADINNKQPSSFRFFVNAYSKSDTLTTYGAEIIIIKPGETQKIDWQVEVPDSFPITEIGLEIISAKNQTDGILYLDYVNISGKPVTKFHRPDHVNPLARGKVPDRKAAVMWRKSWIKACDHWTDRSWEPAFKISNNFGRGLILTGSSEWSDYTVSSDVKFYLGKSGGIVARVQGLQRYYALELTAKGILRLVKVLDGVTILREIQETFELNKAYQLELAVNGSVITGKMNSKSILEYDDKNSPLLSGAIGLVVEAGTLFTEMIEIT